MYELFVKLVWLWNEHSPLYKNEYNGTGLMVAIKAELSRKKKKKIPAEQQFYSIKLSFTKLVQKSYYKQNTVKKIFVKKLV